MKINSKIKYVTASFIFIFLVSSNSHAAPKTTNNYAYIQLNQMMNVNSSVKGTSWVKEADSEQINKSTSKSIFPLFGADYMSNFIVGYMFNGDYGVELEYASYDLFPSKINGDKIGNNNLSQSNIRAEYVFFNFRQDFWNYKDLNTFYKIGFGFVEPNYGLLKTTGGSNLELALQAGLGAYYSLTDFIDLEIAYKALSNYARRRDMYAFSYDQKTRYIESSLNFGVRFKLHSYSLRETTF